MGLLILNFRGPYRAFIIMFKLCLISALLVVAFCQLGGWQPADANDLDAQQLLQEVYYPTSIGEENLTLVKVETQIVSGINYKYTFTVGKGHVTCFAIVHSQPWTGTQEVVVDTCAFL